MTQFPFLWSGNPAFPAQPLPQNDNNVCTGLSFPIRGDVFAENQRSELSGNLRNSDSFSAASQPSLSNSVSMKA